MRYWYINFILFLQAFLAMTAIAAISPKPVSTSRTTGPRKNMKIPGPIIYIRHEYTSLLAFDCKRLVAHGAPAKSMSDAIKSHYARWLPELAATEDFDQYPSYNKVMRHECHVTSRRNSVAREPVIRR